MAAEFVLTLLKKRLSSSPAAFASTLAVHRQTLTAGSRRAPMRPTVRVLQHSIEGVNEEFGDDRAQAEATDDALAAAAGFAAPFSQEERVLLDRMAAWADGARHRPDSKGEVLLGWLQDVVRPEGPDGKRAWSDERVIIFTEYRDTQLWLQERLVARGLGGDRLALLYGGMDADLRELVKARFQAAPDLSPVRILLATDAASEGIDLQRQCHRLVHYEIPWNPNRLEQRNARIDRHGQRAPEVLSTTSWARAISKLHPDPSKATFSSCSPPPRRSSGSATTWGAWGRSSRLKWRRRCSVGVANSTRVPWSRQPRLGGS